MWTCPRNVRNSLIPSFYSIFRIERRNNFKRLLFTWPSLSLFDHFLGLGGTYLHTQCRASNSCQGTMFPLFRKIAHRPASVKNFEKLISNPIGTETNDKKKIRGWVGMGRVQAAEISRTRLSINRKYKAWKGRIETWPPIKLFHDLSCAFYTSKNVYRLTHIPSPFLASTCCVGDLFRSVSTSYLFSSRFLPMVTRLDFCFYKMSIKNLTTVTYTFPSMSRTISVRGKEFSIYVP